MSGAGVLLFQRGQVGQNIKATGDRAQCTIDEKVQIFLFGAIKGSRQKRTFVKF